MSTMQGMEKEGGYDEKKKEKNERKDIVADSDSVYAVGDTSLGAARGG